MSRDKFTVETFFTIETNDDVGEVEYRVRRQLRAMVGNVTIHRCEVEAALPPIMYCTGCGRNGGEFASAEEALAHAQVHIKWPAFEVIQP